MSPLVCGHAGLSFDTLELRLERDVQAGAALRWKRDLLASIVHQ
jgi:hypothetical protein